MSQKLKPADLGEPDLKLAGFQLWVHGRQFPEAVDYDDGNWLRVTAHCGASGASVWAQGAILMVTDIARFGDACTAMYRGEAKLGTLEPLEPEICIMLRNSDNLGHICATVKITPDHLAQSHLFEFDIDQSYLPDIIAQCSEIVRKFPIREAGKLA